MQWAPTAAREAGVDVGGSWRWVDENASPLLVVAPVITGRYFRKLLDEL